MPVIGITGGIATGKSTAAQTLGLTLKTSSKEVEGFSADDFAHQLLDYDLDVQTKIAVVFGREIFRSTGNLNKMKLREMIFGDPRMRQRLEAILHPAIRSHWTAKSVSARDAGKYLVAEIPLLYETQAENLCDWVIVVASSKSVQLKRLADQRGWPFATAAAAIEAQLPLDNKIARSNMLIWNNFTKRLLVEQVELAARHLLEHHG